MERLTNKREADVQREEYERRLANGYPRNIPEERFLRLASYEDTGLTPVEVPTAVEMAQIYSIIEENKRYRALNVTVDRIRELAKADREGRVVVLPCNERDTMLDTTFPEHPTFMTDIRLAISYKTKTGFIYHMGYDVFANLVKHGRIKPITEETKTVLEAVEKSCDNCSGRYCTHEVLGSGGCCWEARKK